MSCDAKARRKYNFSLKRSFFRSSLNGRAFLRASWYDKRYSQFSKTGSSGPRGEDRAAKIGGKLRGSLRSCRKSFISDSTGVGRQSAAMFIAFSHACPNCHIAVAARPLWATHFHPLAPSSNSKPGTCELTRGASLRLATSVTPNTASHTCVCTCVCV